MQVVENLDGNNPLPRIVRTIVAARTVIYLERFGAEFILAKPVFPHVGVSINAVFG